MECVQSDQFKYDDVEYVVECDASYSNQHEKYVIAWSVLSAPIERPLFEGMLISDTQTTVESELKSVYEALIEVGKTHNLNDTSVIVRTDFKGLVDYLKSDGKDDSYQEIENRLDRLDSWCIEKRPRSDVSRPHDIANQYSSR